MVILLKNFKATSKEPFKGRKSDPWVKKTYVKSSQPTNKNQPINQLHILVTYYINSLEKLAK